FRQRIKVLLPEPLGPVRATTSRLRTSKSISLRTCFSPKYLLSLTARIITSSPTDKGEDGGFPGEGVGRIPFVTIGSESINSSFTCCTAKFGKRNHQRNAAINVAISICIHACNVKH